MKIIDRIKSLINSNHKEIIEIDKTETKQENTKSNDCDYNWFVKVVMKKDGSLHIEKSESLNDENCIQPLIASKEELKNELLRIIGNEAYGMNLEKIDYDLAMAYKEADYQIARVNKVQAELDYYRAANDLSGEYSGPRLFAMWNHYLDMKKQLDSFG